MKLWQIMLMAAKKILVFLSTCADWTSNFSWSNVECDSDDLVLGNSEPDSISGLNLWLKADELDLDNDDAVATWADSSGNENDATQTTNENRPTFKTNILNGKPVVRFNGSNSFLNVGNDVFDGISNQTSVFIVAATASVKDQSIFADTTHANSNRFSCHLPWGNGKLYWDFGNIYSNGRMSIAWGGETGTHYIWGFLAGSGMVNRRNGSQIHSTANSSTFSPGTLNFYIGGTDVYWGGDIAEMLIYNKRLSVDEIAQVEEYLSTQSTYPLPLKSQI